MARARRRRIKSNVTRRITDDITRASFDAIIIGAGINGAGIARDASMRGLRVLLLDKGDICAGTSAWSTRLIHGGLRYLEHGELGLVRESLNERETLLRIAPHLVKPLAILIPIYENARRGWHTLRAGMIAYDLLSFGKSLARHHMLTRAETLQRAPGLNPHELRGAALYYDAQVEYAERLVLENVLSAQAHGAKVLTYARVLRVLIEDGAACGVEFQDLLGGGDSNSTHAARAPLVVNVAGPWVDEVLAQATLPAAAVKLIGGTRGSHIVVGKFDGAPASALYTEARADGRPFFIIPWDDKILIGTTDTRYEGDLDRVEADETEIVYLLDETNRLLPAVRLTRSDVFYTYSGVRPLPFNETGAEAGITRRHFVRADTSGVRHLVSIVGGKLTTYRSLSEETVNLLFERLGKNSPPCETARTPLPGAADDFQKFSEDFKHESSLPDKTNARLLKIYGARGAEVLQLARVHPELSETICPETGSIGAEVLFSFEHEMAQTLSDCLLRRTLIGLNSASGLDALSAAAAIARQYLGWDESRAARETADYREYVRRFHPANLSASR